MALSRDIAHAGERPSTIADEQERGELQLAWDHAMGRNRRVAQVFCFLSVMKAAGRFNGKTRVSISPDKLRVPQDYNAARGNQAAHFLPGFVALKDEAAKDLQYMWDFANGKETREEILGLFQDTQDLPASYNRADSAAEGRAQLGPEGLKQLFGQCCQTIVDQPSAHSRETGQVLVCVDRPAVLAVWRQWAQGSVAAYLRASGDKNARTAKGRPADVLTEPVTDLSQGKFQEWPEDAPAARVRDLGRTVSGRKGSVGEFQDQASFLRAYARVTEHQFPLGEAVLQRINDRFSKMPDWYQRF
jgi:hypothetical protein